MFENVNVNVAKKQGNIGVARAIYEYTRMGYTVLAPLSDSDKYDLVVDTGSALLKVQVKTSRQRRDNGSYEVNLATGGGNTKVNTIRRRQSDDYQLLFVLVDDGSCWNIPTLALGSAGKSIVVGNAKYNEFRILE